MARRAANPGRGAIFLGLATFGSLWFLNSAYRGAYQATENDVTALVDGLLLLPDAHWQNWFTTGHTHFFDAYPEWTWNSTPFARPVFQFLIYLAHFICGTDWSSYLAINYLCVAGAVAVTFAISRTVLGLGVRAALFAAALMLASPAVLEWSIWQVGFGSEPLAAVFVGAGFLAVLAGRDLLCVVLLSLAVLSKETAVWAPFAAFFTVLLRAEPIRGARWRVFRAALMLLPVAMWLALRVAFFGGIGGGYATAGYTPIPEFLHLIAWKVEHLNRLFISHEPINSEGRWGIAERAVMIGGYGLVWMLLTLWVLSATRSAIDGVVRVIGLRTWPAGDPALLVTLWAALGLAFYFAVPITAERFATSAMIFVWPALVCEVARRDKLLLWIAFAGCFTLSLVRLSHFMLEKNPPSEGTATGLRFQAFGAMDAALSAVPSDVRQIFVVTTGGLVPATPEYIEVFLGLKPKVVRTADVHWFCHGSRDIVEVDHHTADGWVTLSAMLPDCASFFFYFSPVNDSTFHVDQLKRSDSIIYELPDAPPMNSERETAPGWRLGRRIVVRIRPSGPARFIIEHGAPGGGIAWFDGP